MRVNSPGIGSAPAAGALCFSGRDIPITESDTVASALIAAGELGNRRDQNGGMRGIWCGMGVCHECAVSIDADNGSLACITPAKAGQIVQPQPVYQLTPSDATARGETELTPDVLVIGAGPAGLSATRNLATAGLDVLLLDDRAQLGGQFYKQPSPGLPLEVAKLDRQYLHGRDLIAATRATGARILLSTAVWAAFGSDHLLARSSDERWRIRPKRVVIATGACERGVPLPGWTLPGVMTTGAGQTLLRSYQVAPGARVLVAGTGPLNVQLAAELAQVGVTVVALVETARMLAPTRIGWGMRMGLNAPHLTLSGVRYLTTLAGKRVPLLTGSVVDLLEGDEDRGVRRATVTRINSTGRVTGSRRTFEVDAVCLGYGFVPRTELARALGCQHEYDPARGSLVTVTDETGRTSLPTVWSIGDSAGVRGAKFAQLQGALAAAVITAELTGHPLMPSARYTRAARRNLAFQQAVNALFAAPILTDQLATPDTIVCRCESVLYAEIVDAMRGLTSAPGSVKRITRAGMGACQGRYCGPVLTEMHSRVTGIPIGERSGFAPQAPVRPVPLSDVAAPCTDERPIC